MYKTTKPTVTPDTSYNDGRKTYNHNSFGVIKLFKSNGHHVLFGSDLNHNQSITIEIHRAKLDRAYSNNWIHDTEEIVRFNMSEAQWAQHVSSIGCGTGVPITLDRAPPIGTKLQVMDRLELDSIRKVFETEIKSDMKKAIAGASEALKLMQELADKPTVSKTELRKAISSLSACITNLPRNFEFIQEQFVEAMEQTVQAGKIEIETFVGNLATQTGRNSPSTKCSNTFGIQNQ